MEEFLNTLRNDLLPECFELTGIPVDHQGKTAAALAEEALGLSCSDAYVDSFSSGYLASHAFALWLVEFDEDNWFSFFDALEAASGLFMSRARVSERIELHLIKGGFPPMGLDIPVLIDMKTGRAMILAGRLND